jgi:hypothetical protein
VKFNLSVGVFSLTLLLSSCSQYVTKEGNREVASQGRGTSSEVEIPSLHKNYKWSHSLSRRLADREPSLIELKNLRKEFIELSTERVEYAAALSTLAYAHNANLMNRLNICHLSTAEKACQMKVQDIIQMDKKMFEAFDAKFEAEFVKGESLLIVLDKMIQDLESAGANVNAQLGIWTKLEDSKRRLSNILISMPIDGVRFDHEKFMIASGIDSEVNLGNGFFLNFHMDFVNFSVRELKFDAKECRALLKNNSQASVVGAFAERLKTGISKNSRTGEIDAINAKKLADLFSAQSVPTLKCVRAPHFEPSTYDLKTNTFTGTYNIYGDFRIDSWGIPSRSKSFSFSLFFR